MQSRVGNLSHLYVETYQSKGSWQTHRNHLITYQIPLSTFMCLEGMGQDAGCLMLFSAELNQPNIRTCTSLSLRRSPSPSPLIIILHFYINSYLMLNSIKSYKGLMVDLLLHQLGIDIDSTLKWPDVYFSCFTR